MLAMVDPRGNNVFTNQYDTAGRVMQQTLADGTSTWQLAYVTDSNGNVTQTTITDPRGIVEQKNFGVFVDSGDGTSGSSNANGFLVSDTRAVGLTEHQAITWQRDPNTNLIQSATDALGRTTAYTHDSLGNVTGVTWLSGTSQASDHFVHLRSGLQSAHLDHGPAGT